MRFSPHLLLSFLSVLSLVVALPLQKYNADSPQERAPIQDRSSIEAPIISKRTPTVVVAKQALSVAIGRVENAKTSLEEYQHQLATKKMREQEEKAVKRKIKNYKQEIRDRLPHTIESAYKTYLWAYITEKKL